MWILFFIFILLWILLPLNDDGEEFAPWILGLIIIMGVFLMLVG